MGGPSTRLHWGPALLALAASVLLASPATAASAGVAGRVVASAEPIAEATVYAYQTVEKSLRKVLTDDTGRFRFGDLPAGLYKIVAHKSGFLPTVAVVAHKSGDEAQFVEVELAPSTPESDSESFWTLRSEIPSDVLRDLEAPLAVELTAFTPTPRVSSDFLAQMTALTGVEQVGPDATAQVATGSVGLVGRVGAVRVNLQGDFRSVDSGGLVWAEDGAEGRASAVRLNLEGPKQGQLDLATSNRQVVTVVDGDTYPVDYSQVQVNWRRPVGDGGSTGFLAQYVSESGFYTRGWVDPAAIPLASRALRLEGSYTRLLGDNSRLRAGLRYRQQAGDYVGARAFASVEEGGQERWVDAYGLGDWDINSLVVVQYGLYTTLRDGSVSLTPRGGVVLRFTPDWQASLIASRRVKLEESAYAASEFVDLAARADARLRRLRAELLPDPGRARRGRLEPVRDRRLLSRVGPHDPAVRIRRPVRAQRGPLPGAGRPAAGGPRFAQAAAEPGDRGAGELELRRRRRRRIPRPNRRAYRERRGAALDQRRHHVRARLRPASTSPSTGSSRAWSRSGIRRCAAGRCRPRSPSSGSSWCCRRIWRRCSTSPPTGRCGRHGGVAGRDPLPGGSRRTGTSCVIASDRRRRPLLIPALAGPRRPSADPGSDAGGPSPEPSKILDQSPNFRSGRFQPTANRGLDAFCRGAVVARFSASRERG